MDLKGIQRTGNGWCGAGLVVSNNLSTNIFQSNPYYRFAIVSDPGFTAFWPKVQTAGNAVIFQGTQGPFSPSTLSIVPDGDVYRFLVNGVQVFQDNALVRFGAGYSMPYFGLSDAAQGGTSFIADMDNLTNSIPEPATWLLASLGAVAAIGIARKRRAA